MTISRCLYLKGHLVFDSRGIAILNKHGGGDSKFEDTTVWFIQILHQGKKHQVINQPDFLIWF